MTGMPTCHSSLHMHACAYACDSSNLVSYTSQCCEVGAREHLPPFSTMFNLTSLHQDTSEKPFALLLNNPNSHHKIYP